MIQKDEVLEKLKPIVDPEMQIGIVDLGLIYDVIVEDEGKKVLVQMTLTTPMCPYGPMLVSEIQQKVAELEGVKDAKVEVTFEPPWKPSDELRAMLGV